MLFVVSKEKMISYVITFSTVVILLGIAMISSQHQETIETASTMKEVPIYSVDTQEAKVSLTINCAWNAEDIDSILETLKQNDCKVTFFVVGDWVDKNPEALKKMAEAGHEIGNHSDTHPHVTNMNYEKNQEQIEKCSQKVERITGHKTQLYRGPYGEYNHTVLQAAKQTNHTTIQWSIDSLDYTGLTEKEMKDRIIPKLQNGSIILMHNGTKNTASSLDGIIKEVKQKGFQIVPVSELIYKENSYIDANGIQHQE